MSDELRTESGSPPVSLRVPDAPGMSRMVAVMADGVGQRFGLSAAQAERFAAAVEDIVVAFTAVQPTEIAVAFTPEADSIRTAIEPCGVDPRLFAKHSDSLKLQFAEISNDTIDVALVAAAPQGDEGTIRCQVGFYRSSAPLAQK